MIEISQNIFEIVLLGFNKLWNEKVDESKIEFKSHPIVVKHENYKYEIIEDAKNQLLKKLGKKPILFLV